MFVCESVLVLTNHISFSNQSEKTVALHVDADRTLIVTHAPVVTVDEERKEGRQVILVPCSNEFDGLVNGVNEIVGETEATESLSMNSHSSEPPYPVEVSLKHAIRKIDMRIQEKRNQLEKYEKKKDNKNIKKCNKYIEKQEALKKQLK